jgi:putative ABC transport system permease protein
VSTHRTLRPLLGLAWRESRVARRRLLLYMGSISLGVAALVAIDSFAANTMRSIADQSRAILGGDIAFNARQAWPDSVRTILDSLRSDGTAVEEVTTFATMATAAGSGRTRLAQVRVVTPGYPLYGAVVTSPPGLWGRLGGRRAALVDPALLIALNAAIGDTVTLGLARFELAGVVQSMPGDPGVAAIVGPRVFIGDRWLGDTELLGFGSRAEYEAVVRVPDGVSPRRWVAPIRQRLARHQVRVRTVQQTESNLTETMDQLTQFLGVVGLVALLLGGIGVASGVHAFVQRKTDTVAVLRTLGATGRQVLAVYVVQAAAMGLAGAAAGAALGVGIQFLLPQIIGDFLPVDVDVTLEPRAILVGLGIGVWVALMFALWPLLALRRVSPLVTLRRDAATIGAARRRDLLSWTVTAALALTVVGLAFGRASTAQDGVLFTAGIALSIGLLSASAWLLTVAARRVVRRHWPYVIRQGVANLHRPANQTQSVVIALGFGAFLVSTLYLVQANLLRQFDVTVGASRGNVMFFDVQDDQLAGVDSLVRASGHDVLQSAPIVTMRIQSVRGRPAAAYARSVGLPPTHWALRREYRSTYRDTLVATETLVQGEWHTTASRTDSVFDVSLEREIVDELRVSPGDDIVWDVQGVPVHTRITSVREVNWGRFEPNFFAVFPSAALRSAPQQHILVAAVAGDTAVAHLQREAVTRFPNVSSIDLSLIRGTIDTIVGRAASAVRFLALFSFAMGIPVLFSAVAATRRERLRESVLLKTLGATRRQVGRILLAEYASLGLLGALTGMVLSVGGSWALMHWMFEMPFSPAYVPSLVIAGLMTLMATTIGALTSREVFRATAMDALRE